MLPLVCVSYLSENIEATVLQCTLHGAALKDFPEVAATAEPNSTPDGVGHQEHIT